MFEEVDERARSRAAAERIRFFLEQQRYRWQAVCAARAVINAKVAVAD